MSTETEKTLEAYPGPWSVTVKEKRSGGVETTVVDYNRNPVALVYGETTKEAEAIATLIAQLPEFLFKQSNA